MMDKIIASVLLATVLFWGSLNAQGTIELGIHYSARINSPISNPEAFKIENGANSGFSNLVGVMGAFNLSHNLGVRAHLDYNLTRHRLRGSMPFYEYDSQGQLVEIDASTTTLGLGGNNSSNIDDIRGLNIEYVELPVYINFKKGIAMPQSMVIQGGLKYSQLLTANAEVAASDPISVNKMFNSYLSIVGAFNTQFNMSRASHVEFLVTFDMPFSNVVNKSYLKTFDGVIDATDPQEDIDEEILARYINEAGFRNIGIGLRLSYFYIIGTKKRPVLN